MKADLQRLRTPTSDQSSCANQEGGGEVAMNGGGEEQKQRANLENEYEERVNTLENLFDKAERNDRPTEVGGWKGRVG